MNWEFLANNKSSKIVKTISLWYLAIVFTLFIIGIIAIPSIVRLDGIARDIYIHQKLENTRQPNEPDRLPTWSSPATWIVVRRRCVRSEPSLPRAQRSCSRTTASPPGMPAFGGRAASPKRTLAR